MILNTPPIFKLFQEQKIMFKIIAISRFNKTLTIYSFSPDEVFKIRKILEADEFDVNVKVIDRSNSLKKVS